MFPVLDRFGSVSLLVTEARRVSCRFPFPLFLSLCLGAYAIWLVGVEKPEEGLWRLLMAGSLGIPIFLAIAIFRERQPSGILGRAFWLNPAAVAAIAAFAYLAFRDGTDNCYVRCLHVGFVALLLVSYAGFLGRTKEEDFWNFNKALVLRGVLSAIYALAFFLGAAMLLSSVDYLFELELHKRIYPRMWFFSIYAVFVWHFLAGIPERGKARGGAEYPEALRLFAQYMLVPLVFLYGLILYAYMAKMLIEWDWPRGLVAWMVTAMAAAGISSILVTYPFQRRRELAWIAGFGRLFYLAMIPLVAMHLLAAARRISEYGVTERRYFIVGMGLWVLGVSLYFLVSRSKNIRLIPISASLLALLVLAGPWSAYSVSLNSQLGRLKRQLADNGMLAPDGLKKPAGKVSWEAEREISAITYYLIRSHGSGALASLSLARETETAEDIPAHKAAERAMNAMGLQYVREWGKVDVRFFSFGVRGGKPRALRVAGYSLLYLTGHDLQTEFELRGTGYRSWLDEGSGDFVVASGPREAYRGSLKPLALMARARCQNPECDDIEREVLCLSGEFDGFGFKLYLDRLAGDMKGRDMRFNSAEGALLLRE